MFDLCWTKSHWDRLFSQYFRFTLSVSFHQCFTLIFIFVYVALTRRTNERSLETFQKEILFRKSEALERKDFHFSPSLALCKVFTIYKFTVSCIQRSRRRPNDCYPIYSVVYQTEQTPSKWLLPNHPLPSKSVPTAAQIVSISRQVPYRVAGTGWYEGWNFNSGNYLFTTDTK